MLPQSVSSRGKRGGSARSWAHALVDLSYSDTSPERAQRIANGYADAFMASNLDKRFQANASAKTFLEDKIQQLKLRLEDSEKRLLAFAQDQQIVDVNDKASIAETNLASANAALGNLIAERTKNEQLWRQAEAGNDIDLPQLLSDKSIEDLRAKRKDLAIEYQQKLQTFKPDYPAMVQIKNQMDEIDRQLSGQAQTIKDSLKAAYEASLAQEEDMRKRVETLKQDVLDLQKAQHPIQHPEARGGHQPRSLYEPVAALQGSRCCIGRRRQ